MCFRPPTAAKPQKCPACGVMNPVATQICRKCGTAFPAPKPDKVTCPRCGAEYSDTAVSCAECGLTLDEAMVMIRNTQRESLKAKAAANSNNQSRGELK